MNSGKLVSLLDLLNERERIRFQDFLQSPYFNRSQPVLNLYKFWNEQRQAGEEMPADADLFAAILPEEAYSPIKLKNLKAALQRKLDDFFAEETFQNDLGQQLRSGLQFLNSKYEQKYFPFYAERAAEQVIVQSNERAQTELLQFHLAEEKFDFSLRQGSRLSNQGAKEAYQHAQAFFLLETLKFLVRQENAKAIMGGLEEANQATKLLPILVEMDQPKEAHLYALLLKVFQFPSDGAAFQALRTGLQAEGGQIAIPDAREIYTGTLNHCIRRINLGENAFLNEMLALYKEMDQWDLLRIRGFIPAAQFKNIVSLGLRFGDFEWVQTMIDQYGNQVADDALGNAAAFNQGALYFFQKDFPAAERMLNKVLESYDDVFYGLDARAYLLRVHYERGNVLGMESLAESFKMFLKRNKHIPKVHRDSYVLATNYFRRLIKIPIYDKRKLSALHKSIEGAEFSSGSKRWLLGKIDALLKE